MAESPSITVKIDVDSEALRKDITALLVRFSEWLDINGLLAEATESDQRSTDDLVDEFLEAN